MAKASGLLLHRIDYRRMVMPVCNTPPACNTVDETPPVRQNDFNAFAAFGKAHFGRIGY